MKVVGVVVVVVEEEEEEEEEEEAEEEGQWWRPKLSTCNGRFDFCNFFFSSSSSS